MFASCLLRWLLLPILMLYLSLADRVLTAISGRLGLLWLYCWAKGWLVRHFGRKFIVHKRSHQSQSHQRSNAVCKSRTLDSTSRLGGINLVHLPASVARTPLCVPTSVAATAEYLMNHGLTTPGIFRVPGQSKIVDTLHRRLVTRIQPEEQDSSQVELTIRIASLPADVAFTAHDVASVFKRLLAELDGGILGSVGLLSALRDCITFDASDASGSTSSAPLADTERIATILLQLESCHRVCLISTVFGLLAFLQKDFDKTGHHSMEQVSGYRMGAMTSKAFGVIFAPLLLSNLTNSIPLEPSCHRPNSLSIPTSYLDRTDPKFAHHAELSDGVARVSIAGFVTETLIREWPRIVIEFHKRPGSHTRFLRCVDQNPAASSSLEARRTNSLADMLEATKRNGPASEPKRRSILKRSVSMFLNGQQVSSSSTSLVHTKSVHFVPSLEDTHKIRPGPGPSVGTSGPSISSALIISPRCQAVDDTDDNVDMQMLPKFAITSNACNPSINPEVTLGTSEVQPDMSPQKNVPYMALLPSLPDQDHPEDASGNHNSEMALVAVSKVPSPEHGSTQQCRRRRSSSVSSISRIPRRTSVGISSQETPKPVDIATGQHQSPHNGTSTYRSEVPRPPVQRVGTPWRSSLPMASRYVRTPSVRSHQSPTPVQRRDQVLSSSPLAELNSPTFLEGQRAPPDYIPRIHPNDSASGHGSEIAIYTGKIENLAPGEDLSNYVIPCAGSDSSSLVGEPDDSSVESMTGPAKIAALYAELHRSQRDHARTKERALRAEKELDLMRRAHGSAILNDRLRDAERNLKHWKARAERAEASILRRDDEQASVIEEFVEKRIESRQRRT